MDIIISLEYSELCFAVHKKANLVPVKSNDSLSTAKYCYNLCIAHLGTVDRGKQGGVIISLMTIGYHVSIW